jgi:hypothetical protein
MRLKWVFSPLDFCLLCCGSRARLDTDCFLGRAGPGRWSGGKVEDRPGGDVDRIEGRSSLLLCGLRWENGSLVGSMLFPWCRGGSSIEDRIACLCASVSDIQSCIGVNSRVFVYF